MAEVEKYLEAIRRGVDWLVEQQRADGSMIADEDPPAMFCYKTPFALAAAGRTVEASRLLTWMKAGLLDNDGELRPAVVSGYATYRMSWISMAAHRLCLFDLSAPLLRWLLARQAPGGGFRPNPEAEYTDTICTMAGMAALYGGHREAAARMAGFVASMIDQQADPQQFYHCTAPDGLVLREGEHAGAVSADDREQGYYNLGIPMLFLARLYLETADQTYLERALQLFEFTQRCAPDAYAYTASAKSGTAAAILHRITGRDEMRERAEELAGFLVQSQDQQGWWTVADNESIPIKIDATAEFCIFLTDIAATLAAVD